MDLYDRFRALRPIIHRSFKWPISALENPILHNENMEYLIPFYRYLVGSPEEIERHDYYKFSQFLLDLDNNNLDNRYKKYTGITEIPDDVLLDLRRFTVKAKEVINDALVRYKQRQDDLFYIIIGLDRIEQRILCDLLLSVARDIKRDYPNEDRVFLDRFISDLTYTRNFAIIYNYSIQNGHIQFTGEFKRIIYDTIDKYLRAIEDYQTGRIMRTPLRVSPSISRTQ